VYLWRKTAGIHWVQAHEELLRGYAHGKLVIVSRPQRKLVQLEIVCGLRKPSRRLVAKFGGRVEKLPRNWLERFALDDSKPIKIGKRLVIVRSINEVRGCSVRYPQRSSDRGAKPDALRTAHSPAQTVTPALLVIPASIAFGTGEHATTAMSLRLLEELTRHWKRGWSLMDLGTGSGILALAAKRLGAGCVLGLDIDPIAISAATSNGQVNKIRDATFELADVRKWKSAQKSHIIVANLYSDLLLEILPKLRPSGWLILSGILRGQEVEFVGALRRNRIEIIRIRRRGKWIAILARRSGLVSIQDCGRQSFAVVTDRRYSKNTCKLKSLPTSSLRHIRCGNRALAALLAG
jgi:ribosomal protein L11 methyltransferase